MSPLLPVEIIQQILEYIEDKSSLENLFRVARPLTQQLIAEMLYKEIVVAVSAKDGLNSRGIFGGLHIYQFFVHDYPWLAPYAEQLSFLVNSHSDMGDLAVYFKEVFPVLVNLKRFHFMGSRGLNVGPVDHFAGIARKVLESPLALSLTHFIWHGDLFDTHADALAIFLASQPQLEHLELYDDIPALNLPADSLQRLRVLQSYPAFTFNVLPGRHILDVIIPHPLQEQYLPPADPQLDEAFRRIRSLHVVEVDAKAWAHLVQHFINLEFLKLERAPLMTLLMSPTSKPTRLRYLQLTSAWKLHQADKWIIPLVFEHLPSLQAIDYEPWGGNRLFKRVYRASPTEEVSLARIPRDFWKPWWQNVK